MMFCARDPRCLLCERGRSAVWGQEGRLDCGSRARKGWNIVHGLRQLIVDWIGLSASTTPIIPSKTTKRFKRTKQVAYGQQSSGEASRRSTSAGKKRLG